MILYNSLNLSNQNHRNTVCRKLSFSRPTRTQNLTIPENTVWARSNSLFVRGVGRCNALSLSIRWQGNVENFKMLLGGAVSSMRCFWDFGFLAWGEAVAMSILLECS
jgi:hypothetical protein